METATVNGVKIESESLGSGKRMLSIRGAPVAATFAPLEREPALSLVGRESRPLFEESHGFRPARLAGLTGTVISHATHVLQIEQPGAITAFAAKHRLS